jgi:hypothetical protein
MGGKAGGNTPSQNLGLAGLVLLLQTKKGTVHTLWQFVKGHQVKSKVLLKFLHDYHYQ